MKIRYLICLTSLLFTSCMGPKKLDTVKADYLKERPSLKLADDYYEWIHYGEMSETAKADYEEELTKRGVTESDWKLIRNNKINIGMSRIALYCSWGSPQRNSESVSRLGSRVQHIYRPITSLNPVYVYTENGKVTSWQKTQGSY